MILWEVARRTALQTLAVHRACAHAVAISSDGKYVLSGSTDKTLIKAGKTYPQREAIRWALAKIPEYNGLRWRK